MYKRVQSPLMRLRSLAELTQQQLADVVGVSETTVRNWEKGRSTPTLAIDQLRRFCYALGVKPKNLPLDIVITGKISEVVGVLDEFDRLPDDLSPQPIQGHE
ncbi:helix-turn-helix transcriptional regulator [Neosynechococcus sphagnicola]|uniref:helix-turn-helix transcriptional regulator n=1 Tax=Neosynechococcus sphagnicola TaxID=1501145 RepID=UPI003B82E784